MVAPRDADRTHRLIHWTARLSGSAFMAFFVFLLIGVAVLPLAAGQVAWQDPVEALGVFATATMVAGLILAWWRPYHGGLIVVVGSLWPLAVTLARGIGPWVYLSVLLVGTLHIVDASLVLQRTEGPEGTAG